jgi:hypothetical protein
MKSRCTNCKQTYPGKRTHFLERVAKTSGCRDCQWVLSVFKPAVKEATKMADTNQAISFLTPLARPGHFDRTYLSFVGTGWWKALDDKHGSCL